MKSFRSTLILILVVAAVGGYIYFNERGPMAESGSTVLLRTDPQAVSSLRLARPGNATVVLQRKGDNWQVMGPNGMALPASADAVKGLLEQVQLVQAKTVIEGGAGKLREYGLDKPRGGLTVDGKTIEFGDSPNFDPMKTYARVDGSIALLPATLRETAIRQPDYWRDKAVLRVAAEKARQVRIKAPAVSATLVKTSEGKGDEKSAWKITQPVPTAADAGAVSKFLSALPETEAAAFLEDNPQSLAKWGLDKPLASVAVDTAEGARELLIGKKLSSGYAARNSLSPSVFRLPEAAFKLINKPLREWRSRDVTNFDLSAITQVKIEARGAEKTLIYQNGQWRLSGTGAAGSASEEMKSIPPAVLEVLSSANFLKAQDFIDHPPPSAAYGFDQPALQLTIVSAQAKAPQTLQLGTRNGKVYARAGDASTFGPTVYVLSSDTLDRFKTALNVLFPLPKGTPKKK
jgi:Domain of unknown function (DUF4340)